MLIVCRCFWTTWPQHCSGDARVNHGVHFWIEAIREVLHRVLVDDAVLDFLNGGRGNLDYKMDGGKGNWITNK